MKKILISIMLVLLLSGCGSNNNKNDNDVIDYKKDIIIEKTEDTIDDVGLSVKVDSFYYKNNSSTVNLIVKNNNDYDIYIGTYSVMVYDKDDKLLGVYTLNMNTTIKSGEETNQMFSTNEDYSSASKFEYVFDDTKRMQKFNLFYKKTRQLVFLFFILRN